MFSFLLKFLPLSSVFLSFIVFLFPFFVFFLWFGLVFLAFYSLFSFVFGGVGGIGNADHLGWFFGVTFILWNVVVDLLSRVTSLGGVILCWSD